MKQLMMGAGLLVLLGALSPGTASGRFQAKEETPRQARLQERVEHGRRTYSMYCASCHGKAGRGDGPVAPDLKVEPADLTLLSAGHRVSGRTFFPW